MTTEKSEYSEYLSQRARTFVQDRISRGEILVEPVAGDDGTVIIAENSEDFPGMIDIHIGTASVAYSTAELLAVGEGDISMGLRNVVSFYSENPDISMHPLPPFRDISLYDQR